MATKKYFSRDATLSNTIWALVTNFEVDDLFANDIDLISTKGTTAFPPAEEVQFSNGAFGQPTDLIVEWVTGEVPAGGFTLSGTMNFGFRARESNMTADMGLRARVYRRTPAGVYTEVAGGPFDDGVELSTSNTNMTWSGTPSTGLVFAERDRIAVRIYGEPGNSSGHYGIGIGLEVSSLPENLLFLNSEYNFFEIAETVAFLDPHVVTVAVTGVSSEGIVNDVDAEGDGGSSDGDIEVTGVSGSGVVNDVTTLVHGEGIATGVSGEGIVNDVDSSGDGIITITGVSGEGVVNSITASGHGNILVTSISGTGTVNNVTGFGIGNITVTGVSGSCTVNNVVGSGDGVTTGGSGSGIGVRYWGVEYWSEKYWAEYWGVGSGGSGGQFSGVQATGVVHSVTIRVDGIVQPSGVSCTGTVGNLQTSGTANRVITGVSVSGVVHNVTPRGITNVPATGVTSTGVIHSVTVIGVGTCSTVGVSGEGEVHSVETSGSANRQITGVNATGIPGNCTPRVYTVALLTPVSSTAFVQSLTARGDGRAFALEGVDALTDVHSPTTRGDANRLLGQVAASAIICDVTPIAITRVAVSGVQALANVDTVSIYCDGYGLPVSAVGLGVPGSIAGTGTANREISSVSAIGSVQDSFAVGINNASVTGVQAVGIIQEVEADGDNMTGNFFLFFT